MGTERQREKALVLQRQRQRPVRRGIERKREAESK